MKLLWMTTALVLAVSAPAAAASQHVFLPKPETSPYLASVKTTAEGAKEFIAKMSSDGIAFLDNEGLTQTQKEAEFKKLLKNSFDMNTIGRFAMGTYWNSATKAQRSEYQALFETMIVRVYSARFNDYNGQDIAIGAAREDGNDVVVTSHIIPASGPRVRVDWRVRNRGQGYKIVDVIVEGVSMAMTQRSDFSSVIQRGGGDVQVLIEHLKRG